jgi:hypothetical protein
MIDFGNICEGDVLLFKKNIKYKISLVSKVIRLIQGNEYVHAAIVVSVVPGLTPLVAEVDSDFKSRVVPVSVSMERGTPDVYRLSTTYTFRSKSAYTYALDTVGQKYGYSRIVDSAINHFLGRFDHAYNYRAWFSPDTKDICSTLVSKILNIGFGAKYDRFSEPDDYCKSPFIRIS